MELLPGGLNLKKLRHLMQQTMLKALVPLKDREPLENVVGIREKRDALASNSLHLINETDVC